MPQYVIHIGPHKTGSTYLQYTFGRNRDWLGGHGILYPNQWRLSERYPVHRRLVDDLEEGNATLEKNFSALHASPSPVVLISSEDLSELSVNHLRYLRDLLQLNPIRIVFYCRSWASLVYSSWKMLVNQGNPYILPDIVLDHLVDPVKSDVVNFDIVIGRYAEVFGKDNINIISYDFVGGSGLDLAGQFLTDVVGLRQLPPVRLPAVNVSADHLDTELLRALNALEYARTDRRSPRLRQVYFQKRKELAPDIERITRYMNMTRGDIEIDETSEPLENLHHALFTRYGSCLIGPSLPGRFFASQRKLLTYIRPDYLLIDGAVAALHSLYEKLREHDRQQDPRPDEARITV